mmetsp:Transcript_24047/g.59454  ORF Transcript_24047/g.59454 Transcript_24047/m.59454 type:complete len:81 (-) Transcript_24047:152-394(-)
MGVVWRGVAAKVGSHPPAAWLAGKKTSHRTLPLPLPCHAAFIHTTTTISISISSHKPSFLVPSHRCIPAGLSEIQAEREP